MYPVIVTVHVVVCILLIIVVLVQSGRSGGFAMMGGGGDALFSTSSQQSGFRKATMILAIIFMATSLSLTLIASRDGSSSVLERQFPPLPALPQSAAPETSKNLPPVVPPEPVKGNPQN